MFGKLYVVATPIGNLEDMTFRAIRTLKEAGLIVAEDTRQTRKLLSHFDIHTPLSSYHEHNEAQKGPEIIEKLLSGTDVALVSDAGTPAISDPGSRLVRLAIQNGVVVRTVPGPSAVVAALSIGGLPTDSFVFHGFLPDSIEERQRALLAIKGAHTTHVVYESPRRLIRTLFEVRDVVGGDTEVVVARELTKVHEEVLRGSARTLCDLFEGKEVLGEVVVLIRPVKVEEAVDIDAELERLLLTSVRLKDAVKAVSDITGAPRNDVYARALEIRDRLGK